MDKMIKSLVAYHCAFNRRICASIATLTDAQFTQDDPYSRGSIRNLMVHIASTDRRWLSALRDLPDVGHLNFADYPDCAALTALVESVSESLTEYSSALDTAALESRLNGIPSMRWQILAHMVNHGTDHRATVLQKLTEFGAPTFDQDYILWLWSSQNGV